MPDNKNPDKIIPDKKVPENNKLEKNTIDLLKEAVSVLEQGMNTLPVFVAEDAGDEERIRQVLNRVATRMQDNYPYAHPLYAGQMLKPPHPLARAAYQLAMWVNPNNHALDGGRASTAMEQEAVAAIGDMFGWGDQHLGHLTGGGTMANLEALWVAGHLHPGKLVVASQHAHYTHSRITDVLNIPYQSVAVDHRACLDLQALEELLKAGNVGTVVATLGTTGVGSVDPLPEILELTRTYGARVHVDAAYGGYHCLVSNLDDATATAYAAISEADSIVVDPHKCGLQPYGCGCVLFRDPAVGQIYKHDSPYTYFSSDELHLGEISLECSRAGAAAVALWATQQLLPMERGGEFAQGLEKSRQAAVMLHEKLQADPDELALLTPQLDIVVWAPKGKSLSEISALSSNAFNAAENNELYLALLELPAELVKHYWPDVERDQDAVTCLRSCLMKPEHLKWIDEIWARYKAVR